MNDTSEAIVAATIVLVIFALPMVLIAWIIVTLLSSPIGWVLACVGFACVGFVIGFATGRHVRT